MKQPKEGLSQNFHIAICFFYLNIKNAIDSYYNKLTARTSRILQYLCPIRVVVFMQVIHRVRNHTLGSVKYWSHLSPLARFIMLLEQRRNPTIRLHFNKSMILSAFNNSCQNFHYMIGKLDIHLVPLSINNLICHN